MVIVCLVRQNIIEFQYSYFLTANGSAKYTWLTRWSWK